MPGGDPRCPSGLWESGQLLRGGGRPQGRPAPQELRPVSERHGLANSGSAHVFAISGGAQRSLACDQNDIASDEGTTRPDCAYYASFLCQFMADPTVECWHAAIALLSYMYNSRNLGLLYKRCGQVCITLYPCSSRTSGPARAPSGPSGSSDLPGEVPCLNKIASGCTLVSVLLHGPTSYDCPRTDSSPRVPSNYGTTMCMCVHMLHNMYGSRHYICLS